MAIFIVDNFVDNVLISLWITFFTPSKESWDRPFGQEPKKAL